MKNCDINILSLVDGKVQSTKIGTLDEYQSFNDIIQYIKSLDIEALDKLYESLPSIESVNNIDIKLVSEKNPVGVYSPTELIHSLPGNKKLIGHALDISSDIINSKITVAGFGPASERTQFTGKFIFLNLNYAGNTDNTLLALFETALYLKDPINYENNVGKLLDLEVNFDEKIEIIKTAFVKSSNNILENYYKSILSIYQYIAYNQNFQPTEDIANTRSSFKKFTSDFDFTTTKAGKDLRNAPRELNYTPSEKGVIQSLRQGDLVAIPIQLTTGEKATVYEVFYDYYVDRNGEIIIKTYNGNSELYNRKVDSEDIFIRKRSDKEFKFPKRSGNLNIKITDIRKYSKYSTLTDLIKDSGVLANGKKIISLQGSVLYLEDDTKINISEVVELTINLEKTTFNSFDVVPEDPSLVSVAGYIKNIPLKSKVLIKVGDKFKEGYVINKGVQMTSNKNEEILFVLTSDEKNVPYIEYRYNSQIKYIYQNDKFLVTPKEVENLKTFIEIYRENKVSDFIEPKMKRLLNTNYSVEKINSQTSYTIGDIIYDLSRQKYYKVIDTYNGITISSIFAGQISYLNLNKNYISNGLKFTQNPVNPNFAITYFGKNRYKIGTFIDNNSDIISNEIKAVYQRSNGDIYITSNEEGKGIFTKKQDANDINITEKFKEYLASRYNITLKDISKLYYYLYKNKEGKENTILHDQMNTVHYNISESSDIKLKDVIDEITPGSFITFNTNTKAFQVEKIFDGKLVLSAYHYTTNKINSGDFPNVISERFVFDPNTDIGVGGLYPLSLFVPKWATKNIETITQKIISAKSKPIDTTKTKNSILTRFSPSDSPEVITEISEFLMDTYGIKVNYLTNKEMVELIGSSNYASAFVYQGEVYINIDKASIADPLHEFLHLVLMTMKASNPDTYYKLISSIEGHKNYSMYEVMYSGEIQANKNEEIFAKILSETFRESIIKKGIFNEDIFNEAFNNSIKDLLQLNKSLEFEDSFELLGTPLEQILTMFNSNILNNVSGLIDENNVIKMLNYSGTIKDLIESGNLTEECI